MKDARITEYMDAITSIHGARISEGVPATVVSKRNLREILKQMLREEREGAKK